MSIISDLKYNHLSISLLLLGFFPVVPNFLKGGLVILFGLSSIYIYKRNKTSHFAPVPFIIGSSFYISLLLSLIYTENKTMGVSALETQLSLFAFPLFFMCFLFGKAIISKKDEINFFIFFWLSSFFFYAIFITYTALFHNVVFKASFFRKSIQEIPLIGQHPIYASIYGALAIMIGYFYRKEILAKIKLPVYIFVNLLLLIVLLTLSSKTVVLFIIGFFILITIYNFKTSKIVSVGLFFASIILTFMLYNLPFIEGRFREIFASGTYERINENNSTSIRMGIWRSSIDLIYASPLYGYGVGDVKEALRKKYKNQSEILWSGNYNSHNQYISYWLAVGFIGPLLLILYMLFLIRVGLKHNNWFLISISLFYSLNFLTENILERRSGVILFAFLTNLLLFETLPKEEKRS